MEGDAVSATVGVLLENLINLIGDEFSLIRGLKADAEKLSSTLAMIQSNLDDAQTKSITEPAVKSWLKELEAKAFDADNALDELIYQHLSKEKVPSHFPSFKRYVQRRHLALRIRGINTSFDSIIRTAADLGLQQKLLAAAPAAAPLETNSFTLDPIFIGRGHDVSKIVGMLTTPTEEAVSVLAIVGMGGLGKTTLARNVFNHEDTKTHFEQRIWIHVPRLFDAGVIFKKILTDLDDEAEKKKLTNLDDASVEVVLKKIQKALEGKTHVLVLDDVWNEDHVNWEDFIRSWSGITSIKGNRIIVTTRNTEVGSLVKTRDMHLLRGLSDEECWSIIKNRALESGCIITSELEGIGRSIAERCQGLPLAANMVGGVLRGKSRDEWRSIRENWLSEVGGDQNYTSRILKLSFDNLSTPSLKKCFAYYSIFPQGDRIERKQLIELWMAEGFLQPSPTSDMENVGNQFLKVLLHNSLFQAVKRDEYGEVNHCSMHDLVRDVAAFISDGTYYKSVASRRIPKEEAKWLRTLIYNGSISDMEFSDFKSLHSLTLTDDGVKLLPETIKELIHLRYLNISGTRITKLPDSIGKLYHLQTIRAQSGHVEKLSTTLKHLSNLRHLYIHNDTELPPQLGMLTSLQTLPYFKVRDDEEGHQIAELKNLENLKGELKIYNLEKVQGKEESMKAYLFQKSGIVRLVLSWDKGKGNRINDENVLKSLQPHPNLKMLVIEGFGGASFPSWTLKMEGLTNLMEIRLEHCSECEEIPTLGQLPHLKSLTLLNLGKVKSIGASFYGIDEECKETTSVFPALQRLVLREMGMLTEWKGVEIPSGAKVSVFPCLEYLKIKQCKQLRSAPSDQFTSLKELRIRDTDSELPFASICGCKLMTLRKLQIRRVKGLIRLPDWLFHNNQHLSMLKIEKCPKLKVLPNGMHSLNSLKELSLYRCSSLKSMCGVGKLQGLTSLHRLTVSGCPMLRSFIGEMDESWAPLLEHLEISAFDSNGWDSVSFNKAVDGLLRFVSHSLRKLYLRGKKDWECLPDQLQHLTALSELRLSEYGVEELPEWFGSLSSLQELKLSSCKKLKHLPSMEAMQRLTNLTTLNIYQCPLLKGRGIQAQSDDVDSVWPKISHIPNIQVDKISAHS